MKYIKLFKTTAEYEAYIADVENFIVPNVSLCKDTNFTYHHKHLPEIDYSKEYFTIEALEDGLTVQLSQNASEYRIDSGEWISLSSNTATPSINSGQKISFKMTNSTISTDYGGIGTFNVNKAFNVEGNIMSLLYGDNFDGQINLSRNPHVFYQLFYNCTTLKNAENLILPATTLATWCYSRMFYGCTSLTSAPELPATKLEGYCYGMMFRKCTSLTTAPELPATTLTTYCYGNMFEGCTSLTTAPELPATRLASECYQNMFYGCSKLNYIKMLATDISASGCLYNWTTGVASTGTFVKHPQMTSLPSGYSGIPIGWTVENEGTSTSNTIVETDETSISILSNVEISEDSISINGENIKIENDENNNYNIIIE